MNVSQTHHTNVCGEEAREQGSVLPVSITDASNKLFASV